MERAYSNDLILWKQPSSNAAEFHYVLANKNQKSQNWHSIQWVSHTNGKYYPTFIQINRYSKYKNPNFKSNHIELDA